jgi:hypothetical protein
MTLHVVSVGINLLEALAKPAKFTPCEAAVRGRAGDMRDLLAFGLDSAAASSQLADWFSPSGTTPPRLLTLLDEVRPALWPAGVSAELQTLDATGASRPLADHDIAVLVASDTTEGLLAAMWNALALARVPARVRYLGRPEQRLPHPPPPGSVVIVRVPGMQVGTDSGFREAMRGLGALGRMLLDYLPSVEDCRFHLSGGFKAGIPYLIALAEAMRSEHRSKITAWVQHETTQGAAIRLPLRTLRASVARHELGLFGPDGRSRVASLGDGVLDGYAYERQADGTFCLTAFGEGLRAFFGTTPGEVRG